MSDFAQRDIYATQLSESETNASNKSHKNKYTTTQTTRIGFALTFILALCALSIGSSSYTRVVRLEDKVDTMGTTHSSKMLEVHTNQYQQQVRSNIRNAITGHPQCGFNYTECMVLMHMFSVIASTNFTLDDVINGHFQIQGSDTFIVGPHTEKLALGPGFQNVDTQSIENNLPAPNNCHFYTHGTCIFTHNNRLMAYSHIIFQNQSGYDENRRSYDDFFSYGSSGAGMGSAIGGGIGALVGPEGIPVGAAIGGAVGAIVGGTIGAFQ